MFAQKRSRVGDCAEAADADDGDASGRIGHVGLTCNFAAEIRGLWTDTVGAYGTSPIST